MTLESDSQAIVDSAVRTGAGMLVLGARGLSAFKSAVLGSVSHGVTQHSHLPVLIVPPAATRTEDGSANKATATTA